MRIEFPKITSPTQQITITLKPNPGNRLRAGGMIRDLQDITFRNLDFCRSYGPILSFTEPMKVLSGLPTGLVRLNPNEEIVLTITPADHGMLVASGILSEFPFLELVGGKLKLVHPSGYYDVTFTEQDIEPSDPGFILTTGKPGQVDRNPINPNWAHRGRF